MIAAILSLVWRTRGAVTACVTAVTLANAAAAAGCLATNEPIEAYKGSVLVVGEMHGTQEIPDKFSRMVCRLASHEGKVLVGLEVWRSEQAAIDRFLDSDGSSLELSALTRSSYWHREVQDGRSSQAMLHLLDSLRRMRRTYPQIVVRAIDVSDEDYDRAGPKARQRDFRDEWMASYLRQNMAAFPNYATIVLLGSTHAGKASGDGGDTAYRPMAGHLAESTPTVTIGFSTTGGSAWGCRMRSGELACNAYPVQPSARLGMYEFDSVWPVEALTASPPAVTGATPSK